MILRSVTVRGWRCFADEVRVGPLGERINVIHGPNGTGKSTLFQAMARGFLDAHRVSGEEAEAMRPWGRALTPAVVVEFSCGGEEYRLDKRFLDRPSSELFRLESGRFVRVAEGDAADERVRQFLKGNAPGRGLSDSRHWGMAQVLWTLQGDLRLDELTGDLPNDIRAMLGAQVAGPLGSRLEQRLATLYAHYFTSSGRVRSGQHAPEAVRLELAKGEVEGRLKSARLKLQMFESMSRRLEDLRAGQAQSRREAAALSAAVADANKRTQAYAALRVERRHRLERVSATEAQAKVLKQRLEDIHACAGELARAESGREALAAELPLRARAVQDAESAALQRKAELEDARARRLEVDEACDLASAARRYDETRAKASALKARLDNVRRAEAEMAEHRSERAAVLAPDNSALRRIRKATRERQDADVRLNAALVSLEIVPASDCSVTVLAGETPGNKESLRAGSPGRFKGSPEVVIEIGGFGRIRAGGPTGSVEEYRQQRQAALNRLKSLTESFGTVDLDTLEALHQRAAELDGQLEQIRTRTETLLDGETEDALEQQLAILVAALASIEETRPTWKEDPPDPQALLKRAERTTSAFRATATTAEYAWEAAESARAGAAQKHADIAARLQETEKQFQNTRKRLRALTADGKSDDDRQAQLATALLAWEAAQTGLAETEDQLKAYPEDPAEEVDRLRRQLDAAEDAARRALEQEKLEEGRLTNLTLEGPHSLVAVAEEEFVSLSDRLARENHRMQAIKLLWETYSLSKSEAVAAVTEPVETAATRMLERIAGRRLGGIRLDGGFRPERVRPELAGVPVAIVEASGGEHEQIFLATRLALAEVLAGLERQLVILDDALTASDTGRFARAMRVLEEAAEKLQILILTCHPERYQGLKEATFTDLEDLVATG